ncbi:MAG TPA: alkaline phosphatase [Anaerolineae bacterium]|nr:alkaline phosphatase [Anaerolineae bacterium]HQK14256.1 alkaline phosphatase [Anaerolineae bacterium]
MKSKLSGIVIIALALVGLMLNAVPSRVLDASMVTPAPHTVITSTVAPRNIILLIGDGMGAEHIRAAGMYRYGSAGTLMLESLPYTSTMSTYSSDNFITDSAAAATAMATGHKVANGVLSIAWPGDERELETLLERFHTYCKRAGLVTTTPATNATPAAFGAHEFSRSNYNNIANDYLMQTRPDILFGGGGYGLNPTNAAAAGYTVVLDRAGLQALTPPIGRVSGQFGVTNLPYEYDYFIGSDPGYTTLPHLSEMVTTALTLLENAPNGFFLMVEGGRIDHAAHANDIARTVFEVLEFDRAVTIAYTWALSHTDTLIIVTADHETGGLSIIANNGAGNFPTVTWASTGHTAANVPVYAWGINAELAVHVEDNTDIYSLATAGLSGTTPCTPTSARLVTFRNRRLLKPR